MQLSKKDPVCSFKAFRGVSSAADVLRGTQGGCNPGTLTWWLTLRCCVCVVIRTRLLGGREGTLGSVAARLLCLRCPVGFRGCRHRREWHNWCSAWRYVPIISIELLAGGSRNRTQCLCCSLLNGLLFYCHLTGFSAIKMPRNGLHRFFCSAFSVRLY